MICPAGEGLRKAEKLHHQQRTAEDQNIMELLKLEAMVEDLPPQPDRLHVANGTLMLDEDLTMGKQEIVQSRLPVSYNPDASAPALWLNFLDGLLYPEDIPTLQEFIGYCLIPSNKGTAHDGD